MTDMNIIRKLLSEAKRQRELQRQYQEETGSAFNIFTVLDRERKEESTHCRLIYEMLSPEGSHRCGDAFLRMFFQDVLGKPYKEEIIVYREKSIDEGRIDLVLEGKSCFYPIEVKIDAGDQYRQIERYAHFAEKQRKGRSDFDTTVYYLTLDGHRPSKMSMGEIPEEAIKCITFPKQIKGWLTRCAEVVKDKANVKVVLDQYIQLIDRLEGTTMMDELEKMIGSSKNDYESAIEIAKKLPLVQARKMLSVFDIIEESVGNRLRKIKKCSLQDAQNYYTARNRLDPSLVYCISLKGERSVELWFQVDHYDDTLWYGAVLHKGNDIPSTEKDILAFSDMFNGAAWKKALECLLERKDKWWVWAKRLPSNDHPLYFRGDDKGYCSLFDRMTFDKRMQEVQAEIERQIEHIQKTGMLADGEYS